MVKKFFDKKPAALKGRGTSSENQQLAEKLSKPSFRAFKKSKNILF